MKLIKKIYKILIDNRQLIIFAISFVFLLIIVKGYRFGQGVHGTQLPIIERYLDYNFAKNDWALDNRAQFWPRFYFVNFISLIYKAIPNLPIIYFVVFFIFSLISVTYLYKLTFYLTKNQKASFLMPFLAYFISFGIGGNSPLNIILTPSTIAISLLIASLYYFFKNKHTLSFLLIGVASFFQILYGLQLFLLYLLCFTVLVIKKQIRFKKIINKISLSVVSTGLLIFLAMLPILSVFFIPSNITNSEVFFLISHYRHPWHHLLFYQNQQAVFGFIFLLILFIVSYKKVKNEIIDNDKIKILLGIIIFFTFVVAIGADMLQNQNIVKFQFLKLMFFFKLFGLVYLSAYLSRLIKNKNSIIRLFIIFILMSQLLPYNKLILFGILLILIILSFLEEKMASLGAPFIAQKNRLFLIFIIGALILIYINNIPIQYPILLILPFVIILLFNLKTEIAYSVFALICLFLLIQNNKNGVLGNKNLLTNKFYINFNYNINPSFHQATEWVKDNTQNGQIFITPPYLNEFTLWSERGTIGFFRPIPTADYLLREWYNRIEDLSNHEAKITYDFGSRMAELRKGYLNLNEAQIKKIAKKYHANYILYENAKNLDLPLLYKNNNYSIYQIQ